MKAGLLTGTIVALGIMLTAPLAQADEAPGYSEAKLVKLSQAKNAQACMAFEATFSQPLKEKPTALLDVEQNNLIDGVISFILKVTQLGSNRYSLSMKTADQKSCAQLRRAHDSMTVLVEGGVGQDNRALLPDQQTFLSR